MMIKQKIVVKVQMNCQKCRTQALKIATSFDGVAEVKIEGKEKDQVVVIGEDVDVICLVKSLRKKVWPHAHILTIDEVKPKQD
ncbi:heavy metal-associated isoprenylated plant protein 47-like [Macadamia integrifolia]|uniref:heavy metal-associated isoprenylated plant protein 47-like n=1 Tax=Macadamia integrifolia TaxID=60698 RepID=UPI001C4E898A|nr:heavy metal-associated isoprenylated plant protein 47-like [Macadamia integrifolia]